MRFPGNDSDRRRKDGSGAVGIPAAPPSERSGLPESSPTVEGGHFLV
jgi:hypothetical protein